MAEPTPAQDTQDVVTMDKIVAGHAGYGSGKPKIAILP
jgi:hypothetical protein